MDVGLVWNNRLGMRVPDNVYEITEECYNFYYRQLDKAMELQGVSKTPRKGDRVLRMSKWEVIDPEIPMTFFYEATRYKLGEKNLWAFTLWSFQSRGSLYFELI